MTNTPQPLEAEAMTLYKHALASGDGAALCAFIDRVLSADIGSAAAGAALEKLLRAERARLVKLKTLGLTGDFEMKLQLTDGFIARTTGAGS